MRLFEGIKKVSSGALHWVSQQVLCSTPRFSPTLCRLFLFFISHSLTSGNREPMDSCLYHADTHFMSCARFINFLNTTVQHYEGDIKFMLNATTIPDTMATWPNDTTGEFSVCQIPSGLAFVPEQTTLAVAQLHVFVRNITAFMNTTLLEKNLSLAKAACQENLHLVHHDEMLIFTGGLLAGFFLTVIALCATLHRMRELLNLPPVLAVETLLATGGIVGLGLTISNDFFNYLIYPFVAGFALLPVTYVLPTLGFALLQKYFPSKTDITIPEPEISASNTDKNWLPHFYNKKTVTIPSAPSTENTRLLDTRRQTVA